MTTIDENAFHLELPGQWDPIETDEPGAYAYREVGGDGELRVLLLSVRPVYALADRKRLLSDYVDHRQKFEHGQASALGQSDPVFREAGEDAEASWDGADVTSRVQHRHRVVLANDVLADFCFAAAFDPITFDQRASEALAGASLTANISGTE